MKDSGPTVKSPETIQRAAEHGVLEAQYELGMMYEYGLSLPKDNQAAIFWYCTAAERGSEYAQYKLAAMFENGHGVVQDYTTAASWLRKAAQSGLSEAQYRLGYLLENGLGFPGPMLSEAATWYLLASKQGSVDAAFRLGLLYEMGRGVKKDMTLAAQYYTTAAHEGNANAQYSLGVMYVTGEGVTKDLTQATNLFEAAAAHGHQRAKVKFEETVEITFNLPKPPAPETVVEKRQRLTEEEKENSLPKQALQIIKKSAIPILPSVLLFVIVRCTPLGKMISDFAQQYRTPMIAIAVISVIGISLMVSTFFKTKSAPSWFKVGCLAFAATIILGLAFMLMKPAAPHPRTLVKAPPLVIGAGKITLQGKTSAPEAQLDPVQAAVVAKQLVERTNSDLLRKAGKGDALSQVKLGLRYEFGTGLEKDQKRAASWYASAAKSNDKFAQCRLGMMYKDGVGVEADSKQAVKLLEQSANQDFGPADYQLGLMYEFGQTVKTNLKNAANWYQMGDTLEERHNQYRLGLLLLAGDGINQNPARGRALIESAATRGLPPAAAKMAAMYKFGRGVKQSDEVALRWQLHSKKLQIILPGTEEWLYQQADESIKAPVSQSKPTKAKR